MVVAFYILTRISIMTA